MQIESHTPSELLARGLAKRYGQPFADRSTLEGLWNEVIRTMLTRKSTRTFLDTPITSGELEVIVAAAQSASTSSNLQAWSVVAVRDEERKARIAALAANQKHIVQAPLVLIFVSDLSRLRALGLRTQLPVDGVDYFESFVVSIVDATLAAQNAAVAANSLGLGTCFIGSIRDHPEDVAAELDLPPEAFAVFGLLVGRPDPSRQSDVKPRLPASVVLHHEQYRTPEDATLKQYDDAIIHFQQSQKMAGGSWSEKAAARVAGPEALSGRDRLLSAVRALGFKLK